MLRRGISIVLLGFFIVGGGLTTGCGPPCASLLSQYKLTGCFGPADCSASQSNCIVTLECASSVTCQGLAKGGDLNLACFHVDGSRIEFFAVVQEDGTLKATFVPSDKKICQAQFIP